MRGLLNRRPTPCLQLLSHEALADIDGTAARCTAFALYSKARHMPTDTRLEQLVVAPHSAEPQPAVLPFCSQPLLVLASAAAATASGGQEQSLPGQQAPPGEQEQRQQLHAGAGPSAQIAEPSLPQPPLLPGLPAEQQEDGECMEVAEPQHAQHDHIQSQQQAGDCQLEAGGRGSEPALPLRTLHCFYAPPPPGCPLLPLAVADSCGELLHAELLDTSAVQMAGLGLGPAGNGTDSLQEAAGVPPAASSSASLVCQLVLGRSLELLGMLRAASSPPGLLHSLAIATTGMQPAEREQWRQLVGGDTPAALGLPAGAELAVLDLHVLPPARWGREFWQQAQACCCAQGGPQVASVFAFMRCVAAWTSKPCRFLSLPPPPPLTQVCWP